MADLAAEAVTSAVVSEEASAAECRVAEVPAEDFKYSSGADVPKEVRPIFEFAYTYYIFK